MNKNLTEFLKNSKNEIAICIINQAFKDKKDRGGNDYILHLEYVAEDMGEDTHLALLHDLVEDCPEWSLQALEAFYSKEDVEVLRKLDFSKVIDYFAHITDVVSKCPRATKIKIKDLEHNLNLSRLKKAELDKKDVGRINTYLKSLNYLKRLSFITNREQSTTTKKGA